MQWRDGGVRRVGQWIGIQNSCIALHGGRSLYTLMSGGILLSTYVPAGVYVCVRAVCVYVCKLVSSCLAT